MGVELGVRFGTVLFHLLSSEKNLRMVGVDLWQRRKENAKVEGGEVHPQAFYDDAHQVVLKDVLRLGMVGRVRLIRDFSAKAAAEFPDQTFDFIFIDAAHDYQSVCDDITSWLPKIKQGGLVMGHDYDWSTVARAVEDTLTAKGVPVHVQRQVPISAGFADIWYCEKT